MKPRRRRSAGVPLAGRQDLLPRVGDEHLQEGPVHAVTAPRPLGRMPPVLPEARVPRGDVPLHGGDDVRTQARHGVEHRLVRHPIDRGTQVPEIDRPPLLPAVRCQMTRQAWARIVRRSAAVHPSKAPYACRRCATIARNSRSEGVSTDSTCMPHLPWHER